MFEGQTLTRGIPYIERNVPRLKGPKGTVLNHLQIKKCKRVGAGLVPALKHEIE